MDDAERILSEALESQGLSRTIADPEELAQIAGMIRRQRDAQASDLVRTEIRRQGARARARRGLDGATTSEMGSLPAKAA